MSHVVNRFNVNRKHAIEGFFINLQHGLIFMCGTCVVDDDIRDAKAINTRLNHSSNRIHICHIRRYRFRIRT